MITTAVWLIHNPQQSIASLLAPVRAAQDRGEAFDVYVTGHDVTNLCHAVQQCQDVASVIYTDDRIYDHATPETLTLWGTAHLCHHPIILMASDSIGKATLPRLAAKLDRTQYSDIIRWHGNKGLCRHLYAGNIEATITPSQSSLCISIRTSAFHQAPTMRTDGATAKLEAKPPTPSWPHTQRIASERPASTGPTLATADIVLGGGRGLGSREAFEQLQRLGQRWGAAVGASRAAVDAGFMSNADQIGQTGQIIAPKLYIAIGISGAMQHIAGILDSDTIVAINSDPDAPIFNVANYKLVMRWQDALPELEHLLEAQGHLDQVCASNAT